MSRAQKRDAVLSQKFWFRRKLVAQNLEQTRGDTALEAEMRTGSKKPDRLDDSWEEISLDEIINGTVRAIYAMLVNFMVVLNDS